ANEARNRRRAAHRKERLELRAASDARPGDAAPSPEQALLGTERRQELLAAGNGLSERDRLVLACRYFLDLSEDETASALGCRRAAPAPAERRAGFHLLRSKLLGAPDGVHFDGRQVWLVYGDPAHPRVLLSEFQGRADEQFVKKVVTPATRVDFVSVSGEPGF